MSTDSCAAGDSLKCSTEARKLRDEVEQLRAELDRSEQLNGCLARDLGDEVEQLRVDLERAKQLNVRLAKLLMESYGVEL